MSFLDKLDPTGDDFLGMGPTAGRVVSGIFTGGWEELGRPDPFGAGRNTIFAKTVGGIVTGAATGAVVGFATGGPFGALVGAVLGGAGGGIAGATGATNNYTPKGVAKNVGIGVGAGLAGGGAAALTTASTVAPAWTLPAVKTPSLAALWGTTGIAGVLSTAFNKGQPTLQSLYPKATPAIVTPPAGAPAGSTTVVPAGSGSTGQPVIVNLSAAAPGQANSNWLWLLLAAAVAVVVVVLMRKRKGR